MATKIREPRPRRMWCLQQTGRSPYLLFWTIASLRRDCWRAFRDNCVDEDQFVWARKSHRAVRVIVSLAPVSR